MQRRRDAPLNGQAPVPFIANVKSFPTDAEADESRRFGSDPAEEVFFSFVFFWFRSRHRTFECVRLLLLFLLCALVSPFLFFFFGSRRRPLNYSRRPSVFFSFFLALSPDDPPTQQAGKQSFESIHFFLWIMHFYRLLYTRSFTIIRFWMFFVSQYDNE